MICVTPLEKRTKRWKAIVAARGLAAAYNLHFKYKGEIPDSELVTPVSERGMQDPYIREKYFYDEPVEGFLKSSTVVERISKSSHPLNKVAEYLLPYINKINDSTIHLFDTNEYLNYSGIYDLDQNHININKNAYFKGRGSEPTIIHEVIHSLTMGSIISNTENVQKLNEVYEYLKPMFPAYNEKTKEGTYAMKNLDEFIVALFSDSAFIKELIKIPAIDKSKTSILQEVFDYILSLFNISEEDSVYRQAFNVASNILEDAALYSDFQKDQYEATYYMSPQANPNFAAQLKQWHDNKGKYYTNNKNQADDTYKRLVNFYTNAKVKRPYQINNNLWVVNVSKPVDAAVEEDIKRVTNEGYNKDYIPRIKRVGANQWMTPEGDIVSDADAKDFMSFEDVQAPESLSKFKPIKATDKIIWGHPGIGKSFLRESNSNIIDFDSDYKSRINEKYNLPEGFKARNQWRESNPELWKEEIRQLWSEAKQESQDTGKQLLASDMILLREFPNDFNKVINISDETFINRAKQRDDYTEGETEQWKANINQALKNVPEFKIIQTNKYLSDLLLEEQNLPKFKPVGYKHKAHQLILDNLSQIKGWEKQIKDPNILYRKIQELGIPKSQMELFVNSDGNTVEEKLLDFLSNYSYTIEINVAKEISKYSKTSTTEGQFFYEGATYEDRMWDGYFKNNVEISQEEFQKASKEYHSKRDTETQPTQYYSNLTVPGGTNYTENEIATPQIIPNIKGHGQFATDNGIGWFRSDDKQDSTLQWGVYAPEGELLASFKTQPEAKEFNNKRQDRDWNQVAYIDTNIKDTKTRRILEVQSDLFQKGRDSKVLSKKLEIKKVGDTFVSNGEKFTVTNIDTDSELYELITIQDSQGRTATMRRTQLEKRFDERGDNSSDNQFLQLLNKDNNWVNFFIKSIIQDSAKKGYEKVLFPSGNTASKVEGHTTLEEFKKQKEDRIKELENNLYYVNVSTATKVNRTGFKTKEEAEKFAKENSSVVEKNTQDEYEINQLKQELERVETEGIAALKPIYNFYENNVANVLKKQGYKPVVITDEYGNTWNEVNVLEITPENLIPKFKPKPANTLSDLEVEQFKAALETSLQVGGTINFNYWSESTSQQISEKNIEILSIDDNSFTGRYLNGEERVFRYKNMISKAVPGKYEMHEQAYFKSNLEIGKTVTVESNGLIYSGTITEIGNEDFSIIDAAGDKYTLRYEELDKENYQRKIFQRASEMKKLLEEQIERFSKTAKSEFQVERIALLQQALTHLDTYRGTANLIEFMKVMQTAVFKSRALMKNLSESKELPENEGDKIAEINRRLSMISFLKDYVDSMMEFHKMSYDIYESDSSQELKDKAALLGLEIKYAADTFYEVAIPNLADWLWMCFPKKLNSQLLLVGEKELTKEDLIKELMQPRKDLDFFNSYGVPVANANDMITGLFSKAIKRTLQYAKELHLKLERDLLPYFKKVQDTGANMTEIYKKFYTIKEMETEEEVDVDGVLKVMPVKKNVRVFIEKYDLQKYYDTVRDFKSEIKALGEKIELSTSTNERSALIDQKKKLSARLKAYQKVTAFNYSAPQMNEMMEKLRKNNVPKFLENLKYFYKIGPESENSLKYENEGTVIYYNYTGNFYKPNKEAIDPDTGNKIFLTPEYENLMNEPQETIDLYNEMKSIYDEKNNMLPEHLRLNGVVPVVYEQSILRDASKTLKNRNKYNDAQELRNKEKKTTTKLNGEPYQNVPLGYTRILDVNESSDNIMQSFLYWANDVQMYRAKNDVISSVDVLAKTLEKNSPLEEGETYRSRINRRAEVIKKYANQVLYGETRASNEWWDRVFDYMGKFTAVTRMFIKPSSAINNLIIGNYALLSEAIGGRNFTQKDLAKAYKKYVDLLITNKKKLNNMIVTLDAVQGRFKDEIGADFQTNQDTFGLNTAFALNNRVEHEIQAVSMLALLEKWGVEIPEDGVFESDQLPDNFLGTLHELNKANNGVYSESDRLYHQDESLFRMFMQFRKYIVPTFRSKYSGMTQKGNNKYRMDFEAGSLELGYYRAFGEFVWENIIKIWNLPKIGENWKNLNEIEREGFWRSVVDAVGFLSISFLFLPLAGADDDDWDSEEYGFFENLVHWETIYQLARLRGDIGTYIPGFGFSDQSRLVNQPFAALSTLNQLAKIAKLTFDLKEDNEGNISIWKVYERDYGRYEKGDLKILQPISKLNPLDNPYEDLFPHIQYNDFKAASR